MTQGQVVSTIVQPACLSASTSSTVAEKAGMTTTSAEVSSPISWSPPSAKGPRRKRTPLRLRSAFTCGLWMIWSSSQMRRPGLLLSASWTMATAPSTPQQKPKVRAERTVTRPARSSPLPARSRSISGLR